MSDHDNEREPAHNSTPSMPPPGPPPGFSVNGTGSGPTNPLDGLDEPQAAPAPGSEPTQRRRGRRRWSTARIVTAALLLAVIGNRIVTWVIDRRSDDSDSEYEFELAEEGGRSICSDAVGDTSVDVVPADQPVDRRWFDLTSIEAFALGDGLTISFAFADTPPMSELDAVGVHTWVQLTPPNSAVGQQPFTLTQHGSGVVLTGPDGKVLSDPDFGYASQYGREIVWYLSLAGLQKHSGLGADFDWNGGAVARFGGAEDPSATAQRQPSEFVGTDHCGSGSSASIPGTQFRHSIYDDSLPTDVDEVAGGYVAPLEQALPWLAKVPAWPSKSVPMEDPGAMALTARCAAHVGIVAYAIVSATLMDRPVEAELNSVWPASRREAEWLAKACLLAPRAIAEYRKHGRFIPEARTALIEGALQDCGIATP